MVKEEIKTKDDGFEKHLPVIKRVEKGFEVIDGKVEHPMTREHHIEWIEVLTDKEFIRKFL